jgi:hypothetical protein
MLNVAGLYPTAHARTILVIRVAEFFAKVTLLRLNDQKVEDDEQQAGR